MKNSSGFYRMLLYQWQGLDNQGAQVLGCTYAASAPVLKYRLFEQGIIVRKINKQHLMMINLRRWLATRHTLLFLSQLSAMLKTGITLNRAIDILGKNQAQTRLVTLLADLRRQLDAGHKLSDCLHPYPVLFDEIIIQLLKSGEASGRIDNAVNQAADYYRKKQHNANQMLTAGLYPLMLLLVTLAVLATMTVFVIPQFETIYAQANNELPALTRFILSASNGLRAHGAMIAALFLAAGVALYLLKKKHHIGLSGMIPGVNKLCYQIYTLRFCQTLAELYNAGLPITDCLEACRELSSNPHYARAIDTSLAHIRQGHGLADALQTPNFFDPMLIQLVKTGEESANLANMLGECMEFYENSLNNSLTRLKIMLEPLMIVVLGGVIGVILIAMYLPVFSMGSSF